MFVVLPHAFSQNCCELADSGGNVDNRSMVGTWCKMQLSVLPVPVRCFCERIVLIDSPICKLLSVLIDSFAWQSYSPDTFQCNVDFLPRCLQLLDDRSRGCVSRSVDMSMLLPESEQDSCCEQRHY